MIITFHPELMCIAKVISFNSDMERVQKAKEAKEAEEDANMMQNPKVMENESQNTDISQSTQETV